MKYNKMIYNIDLINKLDLDISRIILARKVPVGIKNLLNKDVFCPCSGGCKGFCIFKASKYKTSPFSIPKECFFNLFHLDGKISRITGLGSISPSDEFYLVERYNKCYMVKINDLKVINIFLVRG